MAAQHYDAVVIGAGQAGVPLSQALARSGRRTALIEREHVGGTCINEGCTPTKTMVASAKTAYIDRRSADYGVHNGPVTVDMPQVRGRKRAMVDSFRNSSLRRIEATDGLDLIAGEASFTGPKALAVRTNDGELLELDTDNVFINAGARPANPPIEGLDDVPVLNSTSIMELDELPDHLLVLGGSYVGLEFAQMFRRFGSDVTVVQRSGQLMGREDADIAGAVAEILREDGIEVLLGTQTMRAERDDAGKIVLTVNTSEGERTRSGSHLLVAAGRPPNTETTNPAAAGVK
jgi:pyruvate/2-oxoglutarate dehydrogenase complex dihydrolipoamide dehydrogenase (E3) component